MNVISAKERLEARRRRILENSEIRLKKITSITTDTYVLNEPAEIVKDKQENGSINPELSDWAIPKSHIELIEDSKPNILEDKKFFNYKTNFDSKLHSKPIYKEIKFSSITVLHIILSQIVLVLFYYDLGFLFGNSIIVPFLPSAIYELYTSKVQHTNLHTIILSLLGLSENSAKQISRLVKLTTIVFRRFCIYIFCFTCSYAIMLKSTNLFYGVQHINSIT